MQFPYNCDTWKEDFKSSNIIALGSKDSFLIVRFKGGGTYRYPDAAFLLGKLLAAKSKGGAFARYIKGKGFEVLCDNGCWAPVHVITEESKTIRLIICKKCYSELMEGLISKVTKKVENVG